MTYKVSLFSLRITEGPKSRLSSSALEAFISSSEWSDGLLGANQKVIWKDHFGFKVDRFPVVRQETKTTIGVSAP